MFKTHRTYFLSGIHGNKKVRLEAYDLQSVMIVLASMNFEVATVSARDWCYEDLDSEVEFIWVNGTFTHENEEPSVHGFNFEWTDADETPSPKTPKGLKLSAVRRAMTYIRQDRHLKKTDGRRFMKREARRQERRNGKLLTVEQTPLPD